MNSSPLLAGCETGSPKLLVSAPEAARMLSVCAKTLWNMTAPRGPIPSIRIGKGGGVRYSVADLQSWIESQKQNP